MQINLLDASDEVITLLTRLPRWRYLDFDVKGNICMRRLGLYYATLTEPIVHQNDISLHDPGTTRIAGVVHSPVSFPSNLVSESV